MDSLRTLTEVATLNIVVVFLRPLLHDDFSGRLLTQKAAGALPPKRALFLYKVLDDVASLIDQLATHHHHLLDEGRTGQLSPDRLTTMGAVVARFAMSLRHLAAALRAIHPAWGLQPHVVMDHLTPWVSSSGGACRFVAELRWETARHPEGASTWRQALSARLDHLLTELDANQRQIRDGLAAVRHFLWTEFAFTEEFFPR